MSYSKKTKCSGCSALLTRKENGGKVFYCGLNMPIEQTITGNNGYSPVPTQKCHKPKTKEKFQYLKKQLSA